MINKQQLEAVVIRNFKWKRKQPTVGLEHVSRTMCVFQRLRGCSMAENRLNLIRVIGHLFISTWLFWKTSLLIYYQLTSLFYLFNSIHYLVFLFPKLPKTSSLTANNSTQCIIFWILVSTNEQFHRSIPVFSLSACQRMEKWSAVISRREIFVHVNILGVDRTTRGFLAGYLIHQNSKHQQLGVIQLTWFYHHHLYMLSSYML